jgi:V8-like Glu-specific endopeptidase
MRSPFVEEREWIGADGRQLVRDTLAVPFRWICALDIEPHSGGDHWRGSGLLVGPRQVLTAAHVLYDSDGQEPRSVTVIPARNSRRQPLGQTTAVAYSLPGRFFPPGVRRVPEVVAGTGRGSDFAIVTLGSDIANRTYRALDGRRLGHWGSKVSGSGTQIRTLSRGFLNGQSVNVAGYPGDKCGTQPLDERSGCDKRDVASTLWCGQGTVLPDDSGFEGVLLHTADTYGGQSGGPVWMRFANGSRILVGIHVAPQQNRIDGAPAKGNQAVHISDRVLAMIRSWIV